MPFFQRILQLSVCALILPAAAFSQGLPTNLFLLPNSSSSTPVVTSFRTDPFTALSSFPVQPNSTNLLLHPNGQKLYSIARSGSDTVLVLDAVNPSNILKRISLAQAEAAEISPDGRRLLIAANGLTIIDTTSDVVLSTLSDVGNTPTDLAVALDGSRAFVLSPVSNRLTAVDLNTNSVVGTPLTIPGQSTGVAVGPDGLVYVSTVNLVQIIDGRTMTVRKEIQLNARPGKLVFSPDGKTAVAGNQTPVTGSSILVFDLPGQKLQGNFGNFGQIIDRIIFGSGNRFYGLATSTAQLFQITVAPINVVQNSFAGISSLSNVTDIAISNEVPNARFMFVAAPGTIYRIDLSSSIDGLGSGQVAIPSQPGPLKYLAPQSTGTPTALLSYNTLQSAPLGGTYLPLIVRATNSTGQPLAAVSVTFTTDNPNAQIQGGVATTNAQGWAQTTVIAPTNAGTFNVTATAGVGPGQPSATFQLTTSTGSGGGGATTSNLTVFSGTGQLVREQFLTQEAMVVQLRDNNGNPVAGQTVTFTLASGSGTMSNSTGDGSNISATICTGNTCTATTDTNGLASVGFLATSVNPGFSYSQQTIQATNGAATVNFVVTTILSALTGGQQASPPIVERIKPTDNLIVAQAGTTLNEAIQVRVIVVSGTQAGQTIPNVALRVRSENQDPNAGPTAVCAGDGGVALSDSSGTATCNLKVGGKLGVTGLNVNIGSAIGLGGSSINLQVRPGPPGVIRALQGNNQSGNPGTRLPLAFLAEVSDSFGNILPGTAVTWEVVTPGSITLANVVSVSDASGRVSALGTLGNVAGVSQVRVRSGNVVQTFSFTTNIAITMLSKISGDGQSSIINQAFPGTLVVEVRDDRNNPVPGQAVVWQVVNGVGSLSGSTVNTDANGRSTVSVTAGNQAGTITVRANLGALNQSFTLTVRPPGPVFSANGITTTARNVPGIVPCALATLTGSNIAIGISGTVPTTTFGIGGLPTIFNGVEVLVNNVNAPIYSMANLGGSESIVVQVPCQTVAPGTATVTVRIPGGVSANVEGVRTFRAAPGIIETDPGGGGRRYAAILRPNGSYVSPANPAVRGEILKVIVTGLGQVTPTAATNTVGLGGQAVTAGLVVGVNDTGVRVVSAEYAPGMIGFYLISFELPNDAIPGQFRKFVVAADSPAGDLLYSNDSTIAAIQ